MDRKRKVELRELNQRAWDGDKDVFKISKNQDSSLKKNTAFIKRARTAITGPNVSTFLQEVSSLSLHKYLSEIISACYEGLCKVKVPADVAAGVEVISALHQRFGPQEFTGYMGWFIGKGLATPDKAQLKTLAQDVREREERDRLARQRVLLKVATELWLVGVLRSLDDVISPESEVKGKPSASGKAVESGKGKASVHREKASTSTEDEPFPLEVLKDLLGHDREHINLPLVVMFLKSFSWDVLGVKQRNIGDRKADPDSKDEPIEEDGQGPPITSLELQQRFKNIMIRYFEDVKQHIIRDQKSLTSQAKRNAEAYVRSGEVFEDRQANYEKQSKQYEKLLSNAQAMADILGLEMPDLKDKEESNMAEGAIGLVKAGEYLRGQGDGTGIWEDDDERRFYENIMDLKDRVPPILLEDGKKKKGDEESSKKEERPVEIEELKPADAEDQTISIANKSVGAQVDGLLARLPDIHNKEMADQFAMDFCFLNSKASRNRLVKALLDVPKGRSDLLPLYSRVIATLSKYMPDVSQMVVSQLDDEFRSLQRRKSKEFLGSVRLQNIRYFAELTKFGIVPEHVIFHCLKVCLEDLSRTNIEIMGNLMENCGRYLLRNPETAPRMNSFLETLQRKKGSQHLEQRDRLILENAMYYVNPPERPAIIQKERTPMEIFIAKLVYEDLTKRNVDKITKLIRKLHWEEPEVVAILKKVFTRPWRIRYNNVHLMAVMLGGLYRYHAKFALTVIDTLLESVTNGLEVNEVKFNQRRVAQVKYLGELYVYRMVDSTMIFDVLYRILTFGHEGGTPRPNSDNPLDQPHDFFRIRLVCTLLEICGSYFNKGPVKKKLEFFITFFQYYINTKDPRTPDIDFAIQDAFAIIDPNLHLINNLDEAAKAFADAVKQNYQTNEADKSIEDEAEELLGSDDDGPDDEDGDDDGAKSEEESEEDSDSDSDSHSSHAAQEDDEQQEIVVRRQESSDLIDPEMDADFDRELAKLMAESMETRRTERRAVFDVPLPIVRRSAPTPSMQSGPFEPEIGEEEMTLPTTAPGSVQFSLLLKRGNKQQTRDIALPSNSSFAVAMKHQQQAEREEQQRIKNLVLNLDNMSASRDRDKDHRVKDGETDGSPEYGHGKGQDISNFPSFSSEIGTVEADMDDIWTSGNPNRKLSGIVGMSRKFQRERALGEKTRKERDHLQVQATDDSSSSNRIPTSISMSASAKGKSRTNFWNVERKRNHLPSRRYQQELRVDAPLNVASAFDFSALPLQFSEGKENKCKQELI